MADDKRNSTQKSALDAHGGDAGDALAEVASILAGALLRLRTRRSDAANKREISRIFIRSSSGKNNRNGFIKLKK